MKITVLGAGSAYGCPMIFNKWRNANPDNPKNIRTRPCLLIENNGKNILIDAGPDLREQINKNNINDIDAVFLTHGHYDHIASMPELSRASWLLGHKINIYASNETLSEVKKSFAYLFNDDEPEAKGLIWHEIPQFGDVEIAGVKFNLFVVKHHNLNSSGFVCENFAFVTDWEDVSDEALEVIKNASILYCECNNGMKKEENGHSSWPEIETRISNLGIEKVILGHLSARVDYDKFQSQLPQYAEVAFDGMNFSV